MFWKPQYNQAIEDLIKIFFSEIMPLLFCHFPLSLKGWHFSALTNYSFNTPSKIQNELHIILQTTVRKWIKAKLPRNVYGNTFNLSECQRCLLKSVFQKWNPDEFTVSWHNAIVLEAPTSKSLYTFTAVLAHELHRNSA